MNNTLIVYPLEDAVHHFNWVPDTPCGTGPRVYDCGVEPTDIYNLDDTFRQKADAYEEWRTDHQNPYDPQE